MLPRTDKDETMTTPIPTITPGEARRRLSDGKAVLIDIREADEFARRHVAGALSRPLSQWTGADLPAATGQDAIFTCKSGMRTGGACGRLAASAPGAAYILEGGIDGWEKAGLPVEEDRAAPLEIMRQVQISAGLLILLGVMLGYAAAPAWFLLAGFAGAGLLFAGLTGFCGMARLLMRAPWNRRSRA